MKYIGIIGNGFVGKASCELGNPEVGVLIYDIDPLKCEPKNLTLTELVERTSLILVSVPTPMGRDGSCCTSIVEAVIREIKKSERHPEIVIRSTVPVGFCAEWGVSFMPEFLTEKNYLEDFRNNPEWIFGIDGETGYPTTVIKEILGAAKRHGKIASDALVLKTTREAEAIKYFRNCFLAVKVSFCNEFYDFCAEAGIDYSAVVGTAAADARIGTSHTRVPGPDGKRGFGGTCFPKDMSSLITQYKTKHVPCPILESAQKRNTDMDRKEQDWRHDRGRAVV